MLLGRFAERVHLEFEPEGIRRIAEIAFAVNERQENIGARRLHTVLVPHLLGVTRYPTGQWACAVPKLAPYSELAFPVPVRPLCKARSTTWRCCTAGGGP